MNITRLFPTLLILLFVAGNTHADWFGKLGKLTAHINAGDQFDTMLKDETRYYLQSKDRCTAKHADEAMKTGIKKYVSWRKAVMTGKPHPKNAFRDAGEAFDYLIKSGCKDGWLHYRYAMMNYWSHRYKKAFAAMKKGEKSLLANYPDAFIGKYYT